MQNENVSTPIARPPEPAATVPPSRAKGHGIKWFLVIPAVLVLFGALIVVIRAHSSKTLAAETQGMEAEQVTTVYPQVGKAENDISLPSTLQAYSEATIYSRTSGYVARWTADIGSHVHQGELLAVIESPEVDQELNQARASLQQTRANLSLAGITANRYQGLIGTNAVAQQEVDQSNQNLSAQKAGLQAAIANVKRLEELQSFERVTAPFDGVITQRLTDVGNLINSGNSGANAQLFRISQIDVIRIFVRVPEIYSDQITDGLTAGLELIQLPAQPFTGAVTRSSHAIDTASHTLLTEIDVPNPTGQLLPGAYADVHLHLASPVPPLVIPTGAVLFQAAGPQVAVINGKNQIELHKVSIGRDFGNTIEITGGLALTEQIVASPPDYLVDGMQVIIQPPAGQQSSSNGTG